MTFIVRDAETKEVYEIAVDSEETLLMNVDIERDEVWVKGNPDAPAHE